MAAQGGGQEQADMTALIDQIHASPTKLVMCVTGGAVHAPTWLLSVPGASRTVLDVRVPYSHESLACLVQGTHPSSGRQMKSVSIEMAVAMAKAAFREATNLSPFGTPVLGVGVTCALATDRDRLGKDQAIICTKDSHGKVTVVRVGFKKGELSRTEQDVAVSTLTIDAVARGCGIETVDTKRHEADREVEQETLEPALDDSAQAIRSLLDGTVQTVEFSGGLVFLDAPRRNRIYLPGSFNPLHDGHKEMLRAAARHNTTKQGAAFELSVQNADKGLLEEEEIVRRVAQFTASGLPLVLTRAPLFTMKSELFPGSIFLVGYDTAIRLVQDKYYDNSESEMVRQFTTLVQHDCSFLVAGRLDKPTGTYCSLKDVQIPKALDAMGIFDGLEEDAFRIDISSTELRDRERSF